MSDIKLSELIGFDRKTGKWDLGKFDLKGNARNDIAASRIDSASRELDGMLRNIAGLSDADHRLLAATILEPIMQVAPYAEQFGMFFQDVNYGDLEDNSIPVEDIFAQAWETHQDGAARYVRAGYLWTQPSFTTYDTAVDVSWASLRKAGWNFLARQMTYAAWEIAKKRDILAKNVFEAALLPANIVTLSGGLLTQAGLNSVVKGSAAIGFPVTQALINPGTLKDMASFIWPAGVYLPNDRVEQLIQTLHLTDYGGVQWVVNPYVATNRVYFSGPKNMVGWHQTKGTARNVSGIDMDNKRDKYLFMDQEHAYYVGNSNSLWQIKINP